MRRNIYNIQLVNILSTGIEYTLQVKLTVSMIT